MQRFYEVCLIEMEKKRIEKERLLKKEDQQLMAKADAEVATPPYNVDEIIETCLPLLSSGA